MSQALELDQYLSSLDIKALHLPQNSADTATAKLHRATTKYIYLVGYAAIQESLYKEHHKSLLNAYGVIHGLADRNQSTDSYQMKLEEATDLYNQGTYYEVSQLEHDMKLDRERWTNALEEVKAATQEVCTDTLRLALGQS